jgi:hypothetical protein
MPTTNHTAPGEPHLVDEILQGAALVSILHDASVKVVTAGVNRYDSVKEARKDWRPHTTGEATPEEAETSGKFESGSRARQQAVAKDVLTALNRAENAL